MQIARPPYRQLILVCTNRRLDPSRPCCGARGSEEIHQELKRRVQALGLPHPVRVSQSGCLDLCAQGPVVLVYPEGRLYAAVGLEDLDRLLEDLYPGRGGEGPALA